MGFTANIKVTVIVEKEFEVDSLEDAIAKAKYYEFKDLVEIKGGIIDSEFEVIGVSTEEWL